MSMIAFVFAVSLFYFLYKSYFENKEKEERQKTAKDEEDIEYHHTKFQTSMFKNFLKSISDRANNNIHTLVEERPDPFVFRAFEDRFKSLNDVTEAIREAGLVKCQVVLGVDFTASNEWQGRKTHSGRSLHHLTNKGFVQNPYQHVMTVLQKTLGEFMETRTITRTSFHGKSISRDSRRVKSNKAQPYIHPYGFGDSICKDKEVFPLQPAAMPCSTFEEVIQLYKECLPTVILGGPTSYAPIINKAIELVEESDRQYHVLIIIADGQFVDPEPSAKAIVKASKCPLSIIVIGVGDGPWDILKKFDNWLPQRRFDNFQFVEYYKILKASKSNPETNFALHMLMEIPDQYKTVKELGLLELPPDSNEKKLHAD